MNFLGDQFKYRVMESNIQFNNGSGYWEQDLSDLGETLRFVAVCGLGVNNTFACSITNGTASTAAIIIWELNTPNYNGSVNIRIFVVCK